MKSIVIVAATHSWVKLVSLEVAERELFLSGSLRESSFISFFGYFSCFLPPPHPLKCGRCSVSMSQISVIFISPSPFLPYLPAVHTINYFFYNYLKFYFIKKCFTTIKSRV